MKFIQSRSKLGFYIQLSCQGHIGQVSSTVQLANIKVEKVKVSYLFAALASNSLLDNTVNTEIKQLDI